MIVIKNVLQNQTKLRILQLLYPRQWFRHWVSSENFWTIFTKWIHDIPPNLRIGKIMNMKKKTFHKGLLLAMYRWFSR